MTRLALLCLLLGACVRHIPAPIAVPQASPSPSAINHVVTDSAFMQYSGNARARQNGHKTQPDEETVLCLYGQVRGDTAYVAFVRPTVYAPMGSSMLAFQTCYMPNPESFGTLQYLGMWHTHWGGVDCGFSVPDRLSFAADKNALIESVSCSKGLVWRGR